MNSGPRVLIIDTYYPGMIKTLSSVTKDARNINWDEIYDSLLLGTGFSYNHYLKKLNLDSRLLVANNFAQYFPTSYDSHSYTWRTSLYMSRLFGRSKYLNKFSQVHQNLLNYVEDYQPDILFVQDLNIFPSKLIEIMHSWKIKLVGEIASPLPPSFFLTNYDLILSSLPNLVKILSAKGVSSQFFPLGFDSRINSRVKIDKKDIDIIFIGSYSRNHKNTINIISLLANIFPNFRFYGNFPAPELIRRNLSKNYFGEAWGMKMFELLSRSKIVLNRHSNISDSFANNMRMFEATGVGSALLTDSKENLENYFKLKKDALAYNHIHEIPNLIECLLKDETSLKKISKSGQNRTLTNYTYEINSLKLNEIFVRLF